MSERAELLAEIERTLLPKVVEFSRVHAGRESAKSLTHLRAIRRELRRLVAERHPQPEFEWELDRD